MTTTGVPSPHPIPEAFPTAGKMDGLPPSSRLKLGTQLLFPGIRSLPVKGHKNVPETDMGRGPFFQIVGDCCLGVWFLVGGKNEKGGKKGRPQALCTGQVGLILHLFTTPSTLGWSQEQLPRLQLSIGQVDQWVFSCIC